MSSSYKQLTWSVDPQNTTGTASDENSGIDDENALLTMAELADRVRGTQYAAGTSCVTRLLSSMDSSDAACFDVRGFGTPGGALATPFPQNGFFTIVGVPRLIYEGTIASPSQVSAGGVGDNRFNDTSAPTFSSEARIWTRTKGSRAYFWPQKDLTGGAWRCSQPSNGLAQASLADGDTWQILELPTVQNIRFPETRDWNQYLVALVCVNDPNAGASYTTIRWSSVQFKSAGFLFGADLHNCRDFIRWASTTAISPMLNIRGGLESLVGNLAAGSSWTFAANGLYTSMQSTPLILDNSTTVAESRLMFFDVPSSCLTLLQPNARIGINSLGGCGNGGLVIQVEGSFCSVQTKVLNGPPIPPGMTSCSNLFQVNGTAAASTPIVDLTTLSQIQ